MNLIKSFNLKFFKENLRKSKGAIALMLLVAPVFTLLVTVLLFNNNNVNVPSKVSLFTIDYIGMYIIPVIMSSVLFGYVYKKKSVDFINSQPINRKTIFVTNTIGGIILITIIQAITAILLLICGAILPKVLIFPQMVLDIFIMMWISYVFVFLVTNLAMSMSGTFYTQIVLTMLIIFLLPFCYDVFIESGEGINSELVSSDYSYNIYVRSDNYYTLPYQAFHSIFFLNTQEFDWFSAKSMSRMVILGIAYYFIGLHLFKNRKMENNEESFANEKIHILVKALTIFPMIIFLNLVNGEKEFNIIAIAIIITYYFIYDFIVKRRLKLKTSLIYLVLTMVLLQGICSTSEKIKKSMPLSKLNTENIASVKLQNFNYYDYSNNYYNGKNASLGGYIENKEFINLLLDSAYRAYIEDVGDYTVDDKFAGDLNVLNSSADISKPTMKNTVNFEIMIKMKNGKVYDTNLDIYVEDFEKIKTELNKEEKFVQNIKDRIIQNGVLTINNYMFVEGEEKKVIAKEIESKVNSMNLEELLQENYTHKKSYICKYYYEKHRLQGITIPAEISDEILKIVSKHTNKAVVEKIKKDLNKTYNYQVYSQNQNLNENLGETKTYLYYSDDITKFILYNENENFDITKPYVVIDIDGRYNLQFYTNKVEEIENIINKAQEYEKSLDEENNKEYEIIY